MNWSREYIMNSGRVCVCVMGSSNLSGRVSKGLLREATGKLRFKDGEQLTRQRKVGRVGGEAK